MTQVTVETPALRELVAKGQWAEALAAIDQLHPSDAAAQLMQLPERQQRSLFKMLPTGKAAAVLPYLLYYDQFILLHLRTREEMLQIVNALAPDDRMRLFDELPE